MAWTLPTPPTKEAFFRPTWYQDCPNPTARQVVYNDSYDSYYDDESESPFSSSFAFSNYGLEGPAPVKEEPGLRRGARLGMAARRAVQEIRKRL